MEPVNLKPTNYCTAMWNSVRCDGKHDQDWGSGVVHSVCGEGGNLSMWRDGYGGTILDETPYIPPFDLESITYAGPLAAIGARGLLDTLAPLNSGWSAVNPQWEMSAGSFKPVEAVFPHSLYPVANCQCLHCSPSTDDQVIS